MMVPELALGQRYDPNKISRARRRLRWRDNIAELTATLRSQKVAEPSPREGNALARLADGPSRCQAFRARSAHWSGVMAEKVSSPRSGQRLKATLPG